MGDLLKKELSLTISDKDKLKESILDRKKELEWDFHFQKIN